jgi:hypothetical protein
MQINWQQASTPRRGSSSNCEMKQVRSQSKKENRDQSCSEPYDPCDRAHHEMASPPCYRPRAWDPPIVRGRPAALTRPAPDSRPARADSRPDATWRPCGRAPHGTVLVRDPIPSIHLPVGRITNRSVPWRPRSAWAHGALASGTALPRASDHGTRARLRRRRRAPVSLSVSVSWGENLNRSEVVVPWWSSALGALAVAGTCIGVSRSPRQNEARGLKGSSWWQHLQLVVTSERGRRKLLELFDL